MGNKDNILIESIRNGDTNLAIKLLSKNKKSKLISTGKKLNVNYQDENGMTSLHQASITGNLEIVKLLIENGAKIDLKDNKGMRALHYAASHGRLDIISLLIRCGSNCNEQTFNGDTPIHLAVQSGHADIVFQFLHYGVDLTITNTQYKSSLDLACEMGKTKIVEILLQSGLCLQYLKDKSKDLIDSQLSTTCLHLASRNGHNDIIRLLILYGFDVNRFTTQGTALHEACRYGRYQSVKVLLECGIDINHLNFNEQTATDVIIKQKVGNDIKRLIKEYSEAVHAISIESYLDNHAGALNFQRDEYITVLEKNPTGHWRGFILEHDFKTRYGYFPNSYVKLVDCVTSTRIMPNMNDSNNCINLCAKAAINALYLGKMTRFSSTLSSIGTPAATTKKLNLIDKNDKLDELTCNISPVGSIDSSSKLSLSNTADSGVGTTSQKSLVYSSPPSTSSRTNTIDRNLTGLNTNKANSMLQSFINQKPFYLPNDNLSSPISIEDTTVIDSIYSSQTYTTSTSLQQIEPINVSDLLRSGLNESQIIYNWLNDINLEVYYENFVNSGYDLLTIMKMTPSDLCAIGISDPIHRKLIIRQMKNLSIRDLDEQLNQILLKTKNLKLLLELIHLEQYLELLLKQGYKTINDLYLINCEDLEEIGIKKLGHQKKLMLMIKRLQAAPQETPSTYDLYATVRKSPKNKININNINQLKTIFNDKDQQKLQQQNHTKSMENLSDDNYLLVNNNNNNNNIKQQHSIMNNKPVPPKRSDSIAKNENQTDKKILNYATLPRKRNLIKNLKQEIITNINNQNNNNNLLPFANENIGTVKIKDSNSYNDTIKQKQQQFYKNTVIIPPNYNGVRSVNNKNYIFNDNNNVKNGHKNDNVLSDIDCMLSDLNKQLDAMLEYEKAFKN